MRHHQAPLVLSPQEVNFLKHSEQPVAFLDATWFMPNSPRNARNEFLQKRIPGAQLLDLDEVASPHELGLKHMMPSPGTFAKACGMIVLLLPWAWLDQQLMFDNRGTWDLPFIACHSVRQQFCTAARFI